MELSLTFKDKGKGHGDILLRFANQEWGCDSYYLAIDDEFDPGAEDETKVRAVLRRLLEQWLETVQMLKGDGFAYLPYDFSDQHTGWLRCSRVENGIRVEHGWSDIEGWSFPPSAVGIHLHKLEGFRGDGPSVELEEAALVEAIRASLSETN